LAASFESSVNHGARVGSGATIVIVLTIAFAVIAGAAAVARRRRPPTAVAPS
jgi:acetyltransferase-like isoleucine patch superfamily enzyme